MLIIGAGETRRLLTHVACIEAIEHAMRALSSGQVEAPVRLVTELNGRGHLFAMPGAMKGGPVYGAKLVNLVPGNPERGRPAVQGFVALFDSTTDAPVALVDGASLTALRTAAASALATRELARPEASTHGIFGAGALAREHLRAIAAVRSIRETRIWARDAAKARKFAHEQARETGMRIIAAEPEQTAACDIVSTVTNAPQPVLQGRWLQQGAHLNLVGAHRPDQREADSEAVCRAGIYVDSLPAALQEAGDILLPVAEGRLQTEHIRGEIGAVLAGSAVGRRDAREITLYKSLGNIAQDLYAASAVWKKAVQDMAAPCPT